VQVRHDQGSEFIQLSKTLPISVSMRMPCPDADTVSRRFLKGSFVTVRCDQHDKMVFPRLDCVSTKRVQAHLWQHVFVKLTGRENGGSHGQSDRFRLLRGADFSDPRLSSSLKMSLPSS
jgi:hypothetical protein